MAVEVLRYENPRAKAPHNANWLECHVIAEISPFQGAFAAALTTSDVLRFRDELRRVCSDLVGTASLETWEGELSVKVQMTRTGRARIFGTAGPVSSTRATLSFEFESDQTFLTPLCDELDAVLRQFPVIEPPAT